jgi:hypothetical protein
MNQEKYIEEKLILFKNDPDPAFRSHLADYLRNFWENERVRQALEKYYFYEAPTFDLKVIQAFLQQPVVSKKVIEHTLYLFQASNWGFRELVLYHLFSSFSCSEFLVALCTALKNDPETRIRELIATVIGKVYWEDPMAQDVLKRSMTQDESGKVRWHCFGIVWEKFKFEDELYSQMSESKKSEYDRMRTILKEIYDLIAVQEKEAEEAEEVKKNSKPKISRLIFEL